MTAKRYDVIDKEEPRGQSVTYNGIPCTVRHCCTNLNRLTEENEQLKQQRIDLLRLIENNIEIYENINTNVEFHKGEIQGKLTLLYNLRELILK